MPPKQKELRRINPKNYGKGWAWVFPFIPGGKRQTMGNWAEPHRQTLLDRSSPDEDAKPVYVALVPMSVWRKFTKPRRSRTKAAPRKRSR